MTVKLSALHNLSTANLYALSISLRSGQLSLGVTRSALSQLLEKGIDDVYSCLSGLISEGMLTNQCALIVEAIAEERERAPDPARLFEIVFSGPDAPGVPTEDTSAVVNMLFQEARHEILLVGYTVFNGESLFEPIAKKLQENPELKVTFCLDIARRHGDTALCAEIVNRFAAEFRQKHWPWPALPCLFYDPRALSETTEKRASLHAKCVVVDRRAALITSANFTEAAQKRNIELGVLVRHAPVAERIMDYFQGLMASGVLVRCPLEGS